MHYNKCSTIQNELVFQIFVSSDYFITHTFPYFRISFGVCGRFTGAELLSFSLALFIVCIWVLTGHWLLMDGSYFSILNQNYDLLFKQKVTLFSTVFSAMGMGLCVALIAFVRLPSLKVSTLLLTGLLIYDVFWVFFSSYIFNTNVMVKVCNFNSLCMYM